MENKEFKYDAFISYRHCELDKFVAENLHKILECYELPKPIKTRLNVQGRTFKRIFRDQEELPLSSNLEDPIIEALKDSKYLIVICSPRLKDSLWCKKEIQTFKKLRGRKNILCVLVEGEPSDSFPEEVLFDEKEIKDKSGKIRKEKILFEPLAADVRGINKSEILKKIKSEKLRLVASMYNIDYDDLKQRHKIRKQKRIIFASSLIACFCLFFALYTSLMLLKINKQKNTLRMHQALSLSSKSIDYLQNDDRYNAVKSSYEALTKFDGVKMPYTSEAEYALVESLGLYDVGTTYKAISSVKTEGVVNNVKLSSNGKYAAVYDESGVITVFDPKTMKIISKYNVDVRVASSEYFSFVGNDKLAYINEKNNVVIVNINGKVLKEFEKSDDGFYISLYGDAEGKYLTFLTEKAVYIYNVSQGKIAGTFKTSDNFTKEAYYLDDGSKIMVGSTGSSFSLDEEEITIHVLDLTDAKEINNHSFKAGYISNIVSKGNKAYILLNSGFGIKTKMLVISYDYANNKVSWSKEFDNHWGRTIIHSNYKERDNLAVINYDTIRIINAKTGDVVDMINTGSEIISVFSYYNSEVYIIFLSNGVVSFFNVDAHENIIIKDKFELNVGKYTSAVQTNKGFLLTPLNENRVILYEANIAKDAINEDIKLDYIKNESISQKEAEKIINEYGVKNKSLVDKVFYDDKKELIFINYVNKDLAIYNAKSKKLLKTLNSVGNVYHYFGKDYLGRIYLGDISDSYILNENYEKVGHIRSLAKLEKNKVIILNNSKYYSLKIYDLDNALKEAKKYLNNK